MEKTKSYWFLLRIVKLHGHKNGHSEYFLNWFFVADRCSITAWAVEYDNSCDCGEWGRTARRRRKAVEASSRKDGPVVEIRTICLLHSSYKPALPAPFYLPSLSGFSKSARNSESFISQETWKSPCSYQIYLHVLFEFGNKPVLRLIPRDY
jgi:hypothetical protein